MRKEERLWKQRLTKKNFKLQFQSGRIGIQSSTMNFVVAHHSEAKHSLSISLTYQTVSISSFQVFQNDHHKLIISGIGKVASAAATGFLIGQSVKDQSKPSYLNVERLVMDPSILELHSLQTESRDDEGNTHFILLK